MFHGIINYQMNGGNEMKKFDCFEMRGITKKDRKTIENYMKSNVDLTVDNMLRVFTESGIYIADCELFEY
jgi:hypothetical protein